MTNRKARVTELITRELSTILARDHAFPNVLVTVTDMDLTPDFKNAHIFIGVIGPAAQQEEVIEKLNAQRGLLSSRVAKRIVLKNMPHFFFKLDHSVERGVRVTALMEQIDQQLIESAILNPEPIEEVVIERDLKVEKDKKDQSDLPAAPPGERPLRRRNL